MMSPIIWVALGIIALAALAGRTKNGEKGSYGSTAGQARAYRGSYSGSSDDDEDDEEEAERKRRAREEEEEFWEDEMNDWDDEEGL